MRQRDPQAKQPVVILTESRLLVQVSQKLDDWAQRGWLNTDTEILANWDLVKRMKIELALRPVTFELIGESKCDKFWSAKAVDMAIDVCHNKGDMECYIIPYPSCPFANPSPPRWPLRCSNATSANVNMTLPAVFSVNFISRARINDLLKAHVISREEIIAYPQPRSARDVNNVRPAIPVKAYLQLNISYECNSYYSQLVFNILENTHDMLLIGVPGLLR
jgi:hypothetical protein